MDSGWWLFLPGLLVATLGTGIFNPAGSPQAYVDGFHDALWVGAVLAVAGAVAAALLIRGPRADVPADVALEAA